MDRWLLVGAVIGVQLAAPSLRAEDTNLVEIIRQLQTRVEELERRLNAQEHGQPPATATNPVTAPRRLDDLDQKVKTIEQKQQADEAADAARAKTTPKFNIGDQGFTFASPNGSFAVELGGVLQVDSRSFFHDSGIVGNDSLLIRRARPILQGTVWRDFDFLFVPDFGGTSGPQIYDAYVNYRYSPALQLQAGKFKSPVGLEQLQVDRDIILNERGLPTDLVPNRDVGFELHGDLLDQSVSYAVGIFNGVGDARISSNAAFQDDKSLAARLFLQPFRKLSAPALQGFGVGLAGSYETMQATNTTGLPNGNGFVTVGQQQFFSYNPTNKAVVVADGEHWRLSPQGYYYYGPFGLLWEYVMSNQRVSRTVTAPLASAHLNNTAWQITGSWVLTGEDAGYAGGVVPRHPFDPLNGNWGALQLAGRYSQLDVDPKAFPLFADSTTSARGASEWSAGLNWWLNRNVRFNTSFSHTTFEGGGALTASPGPVTHRPENVLFTRLQLAF
jgi:phosphate-selective porin OprO/OprP